MSRLFAAAFIAGLAGAGAAFAQTTPNVPVQTIPPVPHCRADAISSTNGLGISLSSGLTYSAAPGAGPILSSWLPMDKVNVCRVSGGSVEITNLNRHDTSVTALRTNSAQPSEQN